MTGLGEQDLNAMQGYEDLRLRSAWLDLTGRGVLRATGEDRARLLHAMTTNHVEQLKPGEGCYAFFLNAQGRILADVNLLCAAEYFMLDTEPETRQFVYEHLEKYIIADDVTLEDLSAELAIIGIEGPKAAEVLAGAGALLPEAPCSHVEWGSRRVARLSSTGAPGFRIFAPLSEKDALTAELSRAGSVPANAKAARAVRLELGIPHYGDDITVKHLPHETQLLEAVHFNKGCYLGQEIVERVHSRGMVHRQLVHLELETSAPPAAGTKITSNGKDCGEITSSAFSPAIGKVFALGYVRLGEIKAETQVVVDGRPARIIHMRPPGLPGYGIVGYLQG